MLPYFKRIAGASNVAIVVADGASEFDWTSVLAYSTLQAAHHETSTASQGAGAPPCLVEQRRSLVSDPTCPADLRHGFVDADPAGCDPR